MAAFRLISDEIITYIPNPFDKTLIKQKNYIIPKPKGKCTVVGFVSHLKGPAAIHPLVYSLVEQGIGIVYVCDKMPSEPLIDEHIHYLECPDRWFIHTLFLNPLNFASVFCSCSHQKLALAFSEFTKYYIPILNTIRDVLRLSKNFDSNKNTVLVEIFGGVGDHLLTIPSLKTLASKGNKVFVLCEDHRKPCFNNLPYIKGFFSKRSDVNISKFKKIIYLHFGQLLNDYRKDFNKQNRIYSVAELCGFRPEDLVIDTPEIIFTKEELALARSKWAPYKNKIFLGYDSARIDSKLPNNMAQSLINKFKARGHTVFVASIRRHSFENCIDLSKKTSLREMFALIAMVDCVVTVDTSFLHVAGALNKKTFCMLNYFKPEWRCGTYKNCSTYTPNVPCFPCVAKQFVSSKDWQCHRKSCYEFQDVDKIMNDVSQFLDKRICDGKEILQGSNLIGVEINLPDKIDRRLLPGKVISVRKTGGKKIAAFWMGGLGDSIMLSYLCRAIKRKYPEANIDAFVRDARQVQFFVFDYPDIKAQFSNLDWRRLFKKIKNDYDIIYEFRPYPYIWHNDDPSLNKKFDAELYNNWQKSTGYILNNWNKQTFLYYAQQTELNLTEQDMQIPLVHKVDLSGFLRDKYNLGEKYLTISSGCDQNVGLLKLWPNKKWAELISKLKAEGYTVIQLGDKIDPVLDGARKVCCRNLIDLMYVLKRSQFHIGNEGGPIHLAHAVGTKSIALFGPTNPTLYGYPDNINIYNQKCPSCWWLVQGWSQNCKKGYKSCINLDEISVNQVYGGVLEATRI